MKLKILHQHIYGSNVTSKKILLLALTMYLLDFLHSLSDIIYYVDKYMIHKFEDSTWYNNLISPALKVDSID